MVSHLPTVMVYSFVYFAFIPWLFACACSRMQGCWRASRCLSYPQCAAIEAVPWALQSHERGVQVLRKSASPAGGGHIDFYQAALQVSQRLATGQRF